MPIQPANNDAVIETYEVKLSNDDIFEIEYMARDDWQDMTDPCPECKGTEFDHVRYEGGHYGQHQGAVIERRDYWDQKGSLYTACKQCDEVLYKNPAYDILEAFEQGDITSGDTQDNDQRR